jgi:trigger factor
VAAASSTETDDSDLAAEYQRLAVQVNEKPNQVRKAYERNDLVPDLVAQIRKSKALDWLLHHVEIVDTEGHEIDRDLILGHSHDEDDADAANDGDDSGADSDDASPPPESQETP